MSDFIFSRHNRPSGLLAVQLQSIYHDDLPAVYEFHGSWGSLAVTQSLYCGFAPVETEVHLCVIIGGPVLTFTDNRFLGGTDPTFGTRLLLKRWNSLHGINWKDDLSGPFIAVRLNKVSGRLEVVTDLMSFIPLFQSESPVELAIGTHIDLVARVAGCDRVYDSVSIADFILHGVVTYPYTFYSAVKQLTPASVHRWTLNNESPSFQSRPYWQPLEVNPYRSLNDAAECLREGLQRYVNAATEGVHRVASFLSSGEDTRVVLAMIPRRCERDTFIFLDSLNREGRVAQAAATANGANFKVIYRDEMRSLRVLSECSDLVGAGSDYSHVHSYGLHRSAALEDYRLVFGGFSADAFLKGTYIKKNPIFRRFPFLPFVKFGDQRKRNIEDCKFVSNHLLHSIKNRTENHEQLIGSF